MYVIVKALSHTSRLNDARNCTKISIAKNAQVGSDEWNICKDIMHESAATKIGQCIVNKSSRAKPQSLPQLGLLGGNVFTGCERTKEV